MRRIEIVTIDKHKKTTFGLLGAEIARIGGVAKRIAKNAEMFLVIVGREVFPSSRVRIIGVKNDFIGYSFFLEWRNKLLDVLESFMGNISFAMESCYERYFNFWIFCHRFILY